jgi:hypothetical protein
MSEPMGEEVIERLLRYLVEIEEGSLSCADAFAKLDEYADLSCYHKRAHEIMPHVHHHLELCPDCLKFYETLLAMLESTEGV